METLRPGMCQAEQRGAGGSVGACPCVLIPSSHKCQVLTRARVLPGQQQHSRHKTGLKIILQSEKLMSWKNKQDFLE